MALKLFTRKKTKVPPSPRQARDGSANGKAPSRLTQKEFIPAPRESLDDDPVKRLAQQGRFNVLVRDEETWRRHPGAEPVISHAKQCLEESLALVPMGSATITQTLSGQPGASEEDVSVEPFLLDVHCVTNKRFQRFIDAGGYDELEFWPEEIWPHLIELKDHTGQAGPRFWRNSRHNAELSNHPVVGISWYEAQAFALWIGQRLPTEAEWQMAASWRIKSSTDMMRRFPWGDAMDNTRCNIWSSRLYGTVPVNDYPTGTAPNQVRQLVGNVWEWTDTEYTICDDEGRPVLGEMPMHVVRGGAFDTYFEVQTTNYFRTGQIALSRTHNTGFRCAVDLNEARWINGE